MDNNDLRTLKIFEEIEHDHPPTQRDLAKKMNISLGLVNSFIKRLAQKGYFKINNISKNRFRYILTPKGAAEKTRLTYKYIQSSLKFYRDARIELRKLFGDFMAQKVKRIVFYGAGELAEIAYISLQETSIKLVAVVDDKKIGEIVLGIVIKDPAQIGSISFDKIFIASMEAKEEIIEKILKNKIPRDKVALLE
jgi:DNA-binding MarR family transcriptional regulator